MRNIILFFLRNYPFLLFVSLQLICGLLFLNYNTFQKATFLNSTSTIAGNIYEQRQSTLDYINLKDVNQHLRLEIELLQNQLAFKDSTLEPDFQTESDFFFQQQFEYIGAHVISSTAHKNRNYLTLNKGSEQGISANMAVKSKDGLVGLVLKSSPHFSLVLPIINNRFSASVKMKHKNYFGLLKWNGKDPRFASLQDVPKHAEISSGDTLITRAESGIYPTGVFIGTVDSVAPIPGGDYLEISVKLGVDFYSLFDVTVTRNLIKGEQISIEEVQ